MNQGGVTVSFLKNYLLYVTHFFITNYSFTFKIFWFFARDIKP